MPTAGSQLVRPRQSTQPVVTDRLLFPVVLHAEEDGQRGERLVGTGSNHAVPHRRVSLDARANSVAGNPGKRIVPGRGTRLARGKGTLRRASAVLAGRRSSGSPTRHDLYAPPRDSFRGGDPYQLEQETSYG